ncbi:MAG: alternative ribosome rescue aminoacyl-tRNA hydrolase ArfB [Planctomycetaceae bacterium]
MLRNRPTIQIPDSEFTFTFTRSSGPGGQNVNKVNSRAVLVWDVTHSPSIPEDVRERFLARYSRRISKDGTLQVTSQRYRDQGRNVEDCRLKVSELVESVRLPPVQRKETKPSRGANQRRLVEKRVRSDRKQNRRRPPAD